MSDRITIERETLQQLLEWIDKFPIPTRGATTWIYRLTEALAAQPASHTPRGCGMSDQIEPGDHVHHHPTGEDWVVRYVKGDRLSWLGWPPGEAKLSDCTLICKASEVRPTRLIRPTDGNISHHKD